MILPGQLLVTVCLKRVLRIVFLSLFRVGHSACMAMFRSFPFQFLFVKCVRNAFISARVFVVLHLVHHPILNVSLPKHFVVRALSLCVFQTVLLNFVRNALISARVFVN